MFISIIIITFLMIRVDGVDEILVVFLRLVLLYF